MKRIIERPDVKSAHIVTRFATVSDRAFPVAAAKFWNELPGDVTTSQFLAAFLRQLKTFFVRLSYPVL